MYLKFLIIILNNVVLVIEPDSTLVLGHEGIFFQISETLLWPNIQMLDLSN